MPVISFAELTKHVHLINDLILTDMTCGNDNAAEEALSFSKHLLTTKYWFARISWANKKLYLLALLKDIRSGWALSLLLKSMWNCRPKDAVLSANEYRQWSSYDQVPMDHNRTAIPIGILAQVMKADRMWFLTLDPESQAMMLSELLTVAVVPVFVNDLIKLCQESQAMMLSELLTVAGGPVMWEVLKRAQTLYERYREHQLKNLLECIVINDEKVKSPATPATPRNRSSSEPKADKQAPYLGQAQKDLEVYLAAWDATIKAMRDSLKLEEVEMTFNDGKKSKIWKVNRPKPEAVETVDFVQLLPSSVGKRIISYLPRAQLGDYSRVNKYWSYLVDEFRAELAARVKIDADFEKLQDAMLRHDTSMDVVAQSEYQVGYPSSQGVMSTAPSAKIRQLQPSVRASEKSGGLYSLRHFLGDKLIKPAVAQKPIRNVSEITELLEQRGAADENLWKWCDAILAQRKKIKKHSLDTNLTHEPEEGVLTLGNLHFPCPMMKHYLEVPLNPPLIKDPTHLKTTNLRRNISNATLVNMPREQGVKRFSLWARNFSSLYHVYKLPSYQCPI